MPAIRNAAAHGFTDYLPYDLRQLGTMRVFRQRGMLISYAGLNQILGVT